MNELKCPICGEDLYLKHGKYGEFIGCSDFPRCRFHCSVPDLKRMKRTHQKEVEKIQNKIEKLKSKEVFKEVFCIICKEDFRLVKIFSTKEKAEQFIKIKLNNDKNRYFVQKDKILEDFKEGHIEDLYNRHRNCMWGKYRNSHCWYGEEYPKVFCELNLWSDVTICNNCKHFEEEDEHLGWKSLEV